MNELTTKNWSKVKDRGNTTATFAISCIIQVDHKAPLDIHCSGNHNLDGLEFLYFSKRFVVNSQTIIASAKAIKYPKKLFWRILVIELAWVANALNNKIEVETGILNLVKIRRTTGAKTCKNLNCSGASFKPFEANLS